MLEAKGTLALAFASTPEGAKTLAEGALAEGLEGVRKRVEALWRRELGDLDLKGPEAELEALARRSFLVLKTHEDRTYRGLVASLSVPWGNTRDDPGGYHLVWTRDAVEAAFAHLALGRKRRSAPSWPTWRLPRPKTDTGPRTSSRTAAPTGRASSWTRRPCPSFWRRP